jgi:hypothetical protein
VIGTVIVAVAVIGPVIVIVHENGNATVGVIGPVVVRVDLLID